MSASPDKSGPLGTLVYTDRTALASAMALTLNHGAFLARATGDSSAALDLISEWKPGVVILDIDAPGGARVLESLRVARNSATALPVVALTRHVDLTSKLKIFESGVDDVLTLPFEPEELLARVLAVVRRAYRSMEIQFKSLTIDDLEIDIVRRRVLFHGHDVHLTRLELALLYVLAANRGQTLSRDEIATQLWGVDYVASSNVIDRHIRELRIKLQNSWRRPRYIFTVPGKGYRFARATRTRAS